MNLENALANLGQMDTLSRQNTYIHRLDARVKIISIFVFLIILISTPKYDLISPCVLGLFPLFLLQVGQVPFSYTASRVVWGMPILLGIGIANPWLDTDIITIAHVTMSAGWLSLVSILLRGVFAIASVIALMATTGIWPLGQAFSQMGVPSIIVLQLILVYRYLFVLMEESLHIIRAYQARAVSHQFPPITVYVALLGNLLLRTLDRGQRIYYAMLARGFTGEILAAPQRQWNKQDWEFLTISLLLFAVLWYWR